MDDDEQQARLCLSQSRKKSGQTQCDSCSQTYNNRCIPKYCTSCSYHLGGTYQIEEKPLDAKMITKDLASVRTNVAGQNTRSFVTLEPQIKVIICFTYLMCETFVLKCHCLLNLWEES